MRKLSCVLYGLLALLVVACGSNGSTGSSTSGWVTHRDEMGFEVRHPRGWLIEVRDEQWLRLSDSNSSAFVVAYPFLSPNPTTSRQCTREIPRLLSTAFPSVRVQNVSQQSELPDESIAVLAYAAPELTDQELAELQSEAESEDEEGGPLQRFFSSIQDRLDGPNGKAVALCSVMGQSGMFYAIGMHGALFERDKEKLISVLDSFKFVQPKKKGAPTGPADRGIHYVSWRDPNEGAFSVEVPHGWRIEGGTFRGGPSVDVRHAFSLSSQDGDVQITVGDPNIPPFVIPTSMSLMMGQVPRSWYDPGYGVKMMVMPYLSGKNYASEYAKGTISEWCPDLSISSSRNRADLANAFNQIRQQTGDLAYLGIIQEITAGDVAFTCSQNGVLRQGYYLAGTSFMGQMVGFKVSGVWLVDLLYGFTAPAEKVDLAEAVISHVVRSFEFDPQWMRSQQQMTAAASGIVAQTGAEIAQMMSESYWSRQEINSNIYRQWSNATLGLTDVRDEATGETWSVASGHNYYWRQSGTNVIAGENVGDRPDIDFTLLREF